MAPPCVTSFQLTRGVFGNKTFGKVTGCRWCSAVPLCCVKVITVFPSLLLKLLKPVCHVLTSSSLESEKDKSTEEADIPGKHAYNLTCTKGRQRCLCHSADYDQAVTTSFKEVSHVALLLQLLHLLNASRCSPCYVRPHRAAALIVSYTFKLYSNAWGGGGAVKEVRGEEAFRCIEQQIQKGSLHTYLSLGICSVFGGK